ncbi:MAG: hypothetical protein QOG97_540 [Acidimicrobiaceae bacterium]|nr:hypothetical protein [Acidimicrobiaceae bacterium]
MRAREEFGWSGHPRRSGSRAPWVAMAGGHAGPGEGGTGDGGSASGGDAGGDDRTGAWSGGRSGDPGFGGPPWWSDRSAWGGMGGGWGGGRGRGGRGGRARRGDVRAAVLLLLAEAPRNGYQIIQELGERSRGAWRPSPGSVYPVLQQLEDEGLVVSSTADVGRLYRITDTGSTYVESHRAEMGKPWEEAANAVSPPAMELAQLIPQVVGAIKQVLQAGTERQVKQAITVLTETRRALYRILAGDDPDQSPEGSDRVEGAEGPEG